MPPTMSVVPAGMRCPRSVSSLALLRAVPPATTGTSRMLSFSTWPRYLRAGCVAPVWCV